MKRTICSVFAVLSLATAPAFAQDDFSDDYGASSPTPAPPPPDTAVDEGTTMTLGVGVARTLGGDVGGEVEYFLGDQLMLTGMLGFTQFSPDVDGADSATNMFLAAGGFYRMAGTGQSALMVGGRLVFGNASAGFTQAEDGSTQFNLEIPARVELWIAKILSVHFEAGMVMAFIPEDGAALSPDSGADTTTINIGGRLFGAGGITVYLP